MATWNIAPRPVSEIVKAEPRGVLADRQTTRGYPRIGTVITPDLAFAGQLAFVDAIEFVPCGLGAAIEVLKAQRARLGGRR